MAIDLVSLALISSGVRRVPHHRRTHSGQADSRDGAPSSGRGAARPSRARCHSVYRRHQPAVRFGPRLPVPSRRLRDIARRASPARRGSAAPSPGRSPSPSRSSSWPFGRRCRAFELDGLAVVVALRYRGHGHASAHSAGAQASWARGWGTRSSPTAPGASCFPSSPWRFCSRPGPPGRPWSSSSRSSPSPWRPPPCRRSPSASAATCTGSSLTMPTPTRRWSSAR